MARSGCCFTFFSLRAPRSMALSSFPDIAATPSALYNENEGFDPPGLEVGERKSLDEPFGKNCLAGIVPFCVVIRVGPCPTHACYPGPERTRLQSLREGSRILQLRPGSSLCGPGGSLR